MSKEYYKKQIIDLKARIEKEKEAKKKDNESYAKSIKSATSPQTKANFKKYKIDKAAAHDKQIAYLKQEIERAKQNLKNCK